jgi:hypothetical protein
MAAYREYQISVAAIDAQTSMSDRERSAARVRLFEQRSRARWALASRGAEALPFAVEMLASSDSEEREDGRALLGLVVNEDDAADFLVEMLAESDDPDLSRHLVRLLAEQPRAIPLLTAVISNPETRPETKQAVGEALAILIIPDSWQVAPCADASRSDPYDEPLEIEAI